MKPVLGVDIGGVIIGRMGPEDTSFFGPNFLKTPAVAGVFESLRALCTEGFEIHLVSKCGEPVERKTRQWLAHHHFFQKTGVLESHVHFCRTRPEKSGICKDIHADYFVDDRLEVLSYLHDVRHLFLFAGEEKEIRRFAHALDKVNPVSSWAELVPLLLASLSNRAETGCTSQVHVR